jgi:beta-phosphoglucomutase-like phosphatase (HAD superfamily)
MHFAARCVVVEDAPCGMVDIEAPFPVVVAEQQ